MGAPVQPRDLGPGCHESIGLATAALPLALPPLGGEREAKAAPLLLQLRRLTGHLVVALVGLVVLGGATRVMQAGLACPDWPLCYGVLLPGRQMNLQVFLEWFHRLDAFVVGVALLVLAALSLWRRRELPAGSAPLATVALSLVALQGLLGALTVTRLLAAPVVTLHLGTALLLLGLVSALHQRLALAADPSMAMSPPWLPPFTAAVALLVFSQCLLGGAMASRWAADLCLSAGEGCRWLLWHRHGGQVTGAAVLLLAACQPQRRWGLAAAAAVLLQVSLGIGTLRLQLQWPLVTVAHQLVAALMVAVLAALLVRCQPRGCHG